MMTVQERTSLPRTGARPEALIREARRRRRRRWLASGAVIAVVAAGAAAGVAGPGGGGRPRPPDRPAPARPFPAPLAHAAALTTVSQTRLPEGDSLTLAAGYGAVWVTGVDVTYQVSQDTGRIIRTISTPGTFPDGCHSGIAAGAGGVWVTHGCQGVYRIDPHKGRVVAALPVPGAGDIAVAGGVVWVTSYDGDLLRIQPRTDTIVGTPVHVGDGEWAMVDAAGALWVTSYGADPPIGITTRIDLATGAVRRLGEFTVDAAGAGSLWTTLLQRIDPATGRVTASVPAPASMGLTTPSVSRVAFWNGSAWVLSVQGSLVLLRVDPATDHLTGKAVPVGSRAPASQGEYPTAIAAGPTGLWVLDFTRNRLFHMAIRPARP